MKSETSVVDHLRAEYRARNFAAVIAAGQEALRDFPHSGRLHEFLGMAYAETGADVTALGYLQTAIRLRSPQVGPWRAAHKPLGRLKWDEGAELEFWTGCNSDLEMAFEAAQQQVLAGDGPAALAALAGVRSVFPAEIRQSLERIVLLLSGQDSGPGPQDGLVTARETPRLVFLSGTGFSGSSAMFDFLREFHDVIPVAGEPAVFAQGPGSLLKVFLAADKAPGFRRRMVDFFFTYLIGFRQIRAKWDLRFMQDARQHVFGAKAGAYFSVLETLAALARQAMAEAERSSREDRVRTMASIILTDIILNEPVDSSKVIALDNVVNVRYIDAIRMFESCDSFCFFRDPRSNYVALQRESTHFIPPVAEWVRTQGTKLSQLKANAAKLAAAQGSHRVTCIQFEEFVLSEVFRDGLAEAVGLDLARRDRHRHFKPWESLRNIVLHQEHPDQSEIACIRKELAEFCCEPHVRMVSEPVA